MIELYRFRYRCERTGKWQRARYAATREEIAARYAEWETTGPPEIRNPQPWTGFHPFRILPHAELKRLEERAPDMQPAIDAGERLLLAVFLRRLVTYYARTRRFAQMQSAAALWQATRGTDVSGRR